MKNNKTEKSKQKAIISSVFFNLLSSPPRVLGDSAPLKPPSFFRGRLRANTEQSKTKTTSQKSKHNSNILELPARYVLCFVFVFVCVCVFPIFVLLFVHVFPICYFILCYIYRRLRRAGKTH